MNRGVHCTDVQYFRTTLLDNEITQYSRRLHFYALSWVFVPLDHFYINHPVLKI